MMYQISGKIINMIAGNKPKTGISIIGIREYRKLPCKPVSLTNSFDVSRVFMFNSFIPKYNTPTTKSVNRTICHISNSAL